MIVLLGAIFIGPYSFALLFLILSVFSLREFYLLTMQAGYSPQMITGMIYGGIVFILSYLIANNSFSAKLFFLLIPLLFSIQVYELFRQKENPFANIALTIFGILYIAVPFSMLNFFVFKYNSHGMTYDFSLLMSIFVFIWSSDSGAYLFGVKFGRNKLLERISPKKSWEGFLGGLFTAVVAAWALSRMFTQYNLPVLIILAVVTVIAGTLGDLVESMIKRSAGVKDSGQFMPGHGGLLDRFDSLLLASPIIFFVLQFLP